MSRRTRTKIRKNQDHFGLGTSHHNEYASSTSYFPRSYSALGKEIRFPSTAVPFLSEGKLTFYGTLETFQEKIQKLTIQDFNSIHTANVGIRGKIEQQMSQVSHCIFALSMVMCCVSQLFSTSFYRDKCFVKYSFELLDYKKVIDILKLMPNLSTIMFSFQDNFLNKNKFELLDQGFISPRVKQLTLRNLSYFIWPNSKIRICQGAIDEFEKIKKTKIDFIFVWEKHNVHYNSKQLEEERQSIAASLCDQL